MARKTIRTYRNNVNGSLCCDYIEDDFDEERPKKKSKFYKRGGSKRCKEK